MESKIKYASVKVMLSYDYSHFEASMSKEDYLEAQKVVLRYRQQLNKYAVMCRYFKMFIPQFGNFSNGAYDIVGVLWFGRLIGKCTESRWNSVMNVGDWKDLPQYHLRTDMIPQFLKL